MGYVCKTASQTWANWYFNGLDHLITIFKGFGAYVRYADDFAIFRNDKKALDRLKHEIADYLGTLRLKIHPTKSRVYKTTDGVTFLGFRNYPAYRILKKENLRRFKRTLRKQLALCRNVILEKESLVSSIAGWSGYACMEIRMDYEKRCIERFISGIRD